MLGGGGPGESGHPGAQRGDDSGGGTGRGGRAGLGVLGAVGEPGPERGHGGGGQQPAAAARGLGQFGDGEAGDGAESGGGEHRRVLPRDVGRDLVRHPVQDGDERDVVLLGRTQQVPGHGVRVPGGGGDEHPDVGGADQLGGQLAVAGDEGVDVGGVEEGEAAGQGVVGLDAQGGRRAVLLVRAVAALLRLRLPPPPFSPPIGACRLLRGHPDPAQLRQHPQPREPVVVVGVAHQYGRTRGRSQHSGRRDPPPDERVDESGLPGPRGAPDDGEQRRFGGPQPGHQVVVELRQQLDTAEARAGRAWKGERETCGVYTVTQCGQCVEQSGPYVQGRHMCRMPNFVGFLKRMAIGARGVASEAQA